MDKVDVLMHISGHGESDLCEWANDNLQELAWQPIETAPKDGTEILVYTRSECFYVVAYDDVFSAPWRIRNDEGLNEAVPTHWMPLPEAPTAEPSRPREAG